MKLPGRNLRPGDGKVSRVATLKQLFQAKSIQKWESKKISIQISKSEGNIARKTRSIEDKVIINQLTLSVIASQLHGSEDEAPSNIAFILSLGPAASFPRSCDVITEKAY